MTSNGQTTDLADLWGEFSVFYPGQSPPESAVALNAAVGTGRRKRALFVKLYPGQTPPQSLAALDGAIGPAPNASAQQAYKPRSPLKSS